jgi:hypothetical protein
MDFKRPQNMEKTKKRTSTVKDRVFIFIIIACIAMILVYQVQSVITLLNPETTIRVVNTPSSYIEIVVEDEDMVVFTTPTPLHLKED